MANQHEHRIWHVPEMLEAILFDLPMKDLLLSQGVCKRWKSCIEASTKLRKKLFLSPDGTPIFDTFSIFHKDPKFVYADYFEFNSLLTDYVHALRDGRLFQSDDGTGVVNKKTLEDMQSWTKMHLTQPPLKYHLMTTWWRIIYKDKINHYTVRGVCDLAYNQEGLTMGDVFRAAGRRFDRLKREPSEVVDFGWVQNDKFWENWNEEEDEDEEDDDSDGAY